MAAKIYPAFPGASGAARRVWRVDVSPEDGLLRCRAAGCLGAMGPATRFAALAHLADHARREPMAEHLRTCCCHARGCRWHPRHRGCSGQVLLVVFRQDRGRTWQLADVCAGCATAIPEVAEVPIASPPTRLPEADRTGAVAAASVLRPPRGSAGRASLGAVLHYLDAALPTESSAGAVLLALLCVLSADSVAKAHLPAGLLRSVRVEHDAETRVAELRAARWLCDEVRWLGTWPDLPGGGVVVRMVDLAASPGVLSGRRVLRGLRGDVLTTLARPSVRGRDDAARVAALRRLAAAMPQDSTIPSGIADEDAK